MHTTNVTYVEQTIALKSVPIAVMRHDDRFGDVEGKEYTVEAGVFDGKEYKDGDTIFVPNRDKGRGVVSDRREDTLNEHVRKFSGAPVFNEEHRLGLVKTYSYKQNVEEMHRDHLSQTPEEEPKYSNAPDDISIGGNEYVKTGKLDGVGAVYMPK